MIDNDLHQTYGIDTADPTLMGARSWWWLRNRIDGLTQDTTTRTFRILSAEQ